MSDIPEDIKKIALEYVAYISGGSIKENARAFAEAIWSERQRCAKIAEDEDGHFTIWGEDRNTKTSQATARAISQAILNQTGD